VGKFRLVEKLIEASIGSASAGRLILNEGKNGKFSTRAQMHLLLLKDFGTGKSSSVAEYLKDRRYVVPLTEFTYPGLVGSIDKNGDFNQGALIEAAGKCLLIDEGQNLSEKARDVMLSLLEEQYYSRSLGFAVRKEINDGSEFYSVNVKDGSISLAVRFSCIFLGMGMPRHYNRSYLYAWLSRFVPIRMVSGLQDVYKMVRGESLLRISRPKMMRGDFYFDDYLDYVDSHEELVNSLPFKEKLMERNMAGFVARNVTDMARFAAYLSWKESGKNKVLKSKWKEVLNYVPLVLRNYFFNDISEREFEIYNLYSEGFKVYDIAREVGMDPSNVSKYLSSLREKGLINNEGKTIDEEVEEIVGSK